jgi:O-methyltransferase
MRQPRELYLDLLKKTLSFSLWPEPPVDLAFFGHKQTRFQRLVLGPLDRMLRRRNYRIMVDRPMTLRQRQGGEVWPSYADTMAGMKRLDNLQMAVETVLAEQIPGDLIETGVWRGGSCILMKAVLAAHGVRNRRLFVADSFEGLPPPDAAYPLDKHDTLYQEDFLRVSEEQVRKNFRRYGLLDKQVVFLKGFFADTLPKAPIEKLAILRLDGDMYSSTMDALNALYHKLQPGGFCIVDDYALLTCAAAVQDFRAKHGIEDEMIQIDRIALYWRKGK